MFEQVNSLFNKVSHKLGVGDQLKASHICFLARQFFAKEGFTEDQVNVISYKSNFLKIKTSHPIISQKLKALEPKLKTEIHQLQLKLQLI